MRSSYNSKIGSVDISDLGSTVTGAISNLKGARLIYTIPSNTYSNHLQAITALSPYWKALPYEQKVSSCIMWGELAFNIVDTDGIFSLTSFYISSVGSNPVVQQTFIIDVYSNPHKFMYSELQTGSSLTWNNVANGAQSRSFSLYCK